MVLASFGDDIGTMMGWSIAHWHSTRTTLAAGLCSGVLRLWAGQPDIASIMSIPRCG